MGSSSSITRSISTASSSRSSSSGTSTRSVLKRDDLPQQRTSREQIAQFSNLREDFLASEVSQDDRVTISLFLDDWIMFARAANLTKADIEAIQHDGQSENDRRYRTLERWHQISPFDATFKNLIAIMLRLKRRDIAEQICELQEFKINEPPTSKLKRRDQVESVIKLPSNPPAQHVLKKQFHNIKHETLTTVELQERVTKLFLETADISCKFHELFSYIYKSLQKRNVPTKQLVTCLIGLEMFPPVYESANQPLFKDQLPALRAAKDIECVFYIVKDYCSFFSTHIIEHITDKLGTADDKKEINSYKQKFEVYMKREFSDCPTELAPINAQDCTIIVKLDACYDDCTAYHINVFQTKLCAILNVVQGALRLCQAKKGCYKLTFQAPNLVKDVVFPLSNDQKSALKKLGVIYLICGDYKFSSQDEDNNEGSEGDSDDDDPDYWINSNDIVQESLPYKAENVAQVDLFSKHQGDDSDDDSAIYTASTCLDQLYTGTVSEDVLHSTFGDTAIDKYHTTTTKAQIKLHEVVYNGNLLMVRFLTEILRQDPLSQNEQGYTAVHLSVMYGHLNILTYFIEQQNINPACVAGNKMTPLHLAAYYGQHHIAQYLIQEQQVEPLCYDSKQRTPLHLACHQGNIDVLKYIISNCQYYSSETLVDEITRQKYTLLHFACLSGNIELVRYLIAKLKFKPTVLGHLYSTPLHLAAQKGHVSIVKYLIDEQECDPNCELEQSKHTPLSLAAANGYTTVVRYLVKDKKCDPNHQIQNLLTPLHLASYFGHIDVIELLANCGAKIELADIHKKTPLHTAAQRGHFEICLHLVESYKCSLRCQTKIGWTPLHFATFNEHIKIVNFFMEKKHSLAISGDENKNTPLHIAAISGNAEITEALLFRFDKTKVSKLVRLSVLKAAVKGGCINVLNYLLNKLYDQKMETQLLHFVASEGVVTILMHLISDKLFDPSVIDSQGNTLLHIAASRNHLEIIQLLKKLNKCDPNHQNIRGLTPLHIAVSKGYVDIVKYLVNSYKCDVRTLSATYVSPLHLAVDNAHLNVIKFLTLEVGMSMMEKNERNDTPIHCAVRKGSHNILAFYLLELNGNQDAIGSKGFTLLHVACQQGHLSSAKLLVEFNCNIYARDTSNNTPLHIASQYGHISLVKFLINDLRCYPICRNTSYNLPLHLAALNGHLQIVKFYIDELKLNPNITGKDHFAILHFASQQGHDHIVEYLSSLPKTDFNAKGKNGYQPLHCAVEKGQIEIVRFLTDYKNCDPYTLTENDMNSFHIAASKGQLEILKYFLRNQPIHDVTVIHAAVINSQLEAFEYLVHSSTLNADEQFSICRIASDTGNTAILKSCLKRNFNSEGGDKTIDKILGFTLMHHAAQNGRLGIVNLLIKEFKVDPNIQDNFGYTPLHTASIYGQLDVVKYLMKINNNDSKKINRFLKTTPLHLAAESGHLKTFKFLIKMKFNPNAGNRLNNAPLHLAALSGKLDIVKYLLEDLKLNPDALGNQKYTPLHCACQNGHLCIVKYLVKTCKCNKFMKTEKQEIPLLIATRHGRLEIVKYLIEKGHCNPTSTYFYSFTILHQAANTGQVEILKYLIKDRHCNANIQGGEYGVTPLHVAADAGQLNAVMYLIDECGCDPQQLSDSGDTPLHLAVEKGHLNVVHYLALKKKCDILCPNENDETPFKLAETFQPDTEIHYLLQTIIKIQNRKVRKPKPQAVYLPPVYLTSDIEMTILKSAEHGRLDYMRYLVFTRKINVYTRNEHGATPLHIAALFGHILTVLFLVEEACCNPDCLDHLERTPLFYAAMSDKSSVIQNLVLELGANPLAKDVFNNQALHYATALGNLDCVFLFVIEYRSLCPYNYYSRGIFDMTPIEMAEVANHTKIIELFTKFLQVMYQYVLD